MFWIENNTFIMFWLKNLIEIILKTTPKFFSLFKSLHDFYDNYIYRMNN